MVVSGKHVSSMVVSRTKPLRKRGLNQYQRVVDDTSSRCGLAYGAAKRETLGANRVSSGGKPSSADSTVSDMVAICLEEEIMIQLGKLGVPRYTPVFALVCPCTRGHKARPMATELSG